MRYVFGNCELDADTLVLSRAGAPVPVEPQVFDLIRLLLERIACPTLIVHARYDSVHPLSEARKLAAGIANSELIALECRNHIPMPGNPAFDAYLTAFTDFLAEDRTV